MANDFMKTITDTVDLELVRILRRHCEPDCAAALIREFRRVTRTDVVPAPDATKNRPNTALRKKVNRFALLCREKLSGETLFRVVLDIGDIMRRDGDLRRAEELYGEVLEGGITCEDRHLVAESRIRRGEVHARQARWKDSYDDLIESKRLFIDLQRKADVARVNNILGTNFAEQGILDQARISLEEALGVFSGSSEKKMEGSVLMNMGIVHDIIGEFDTALLHYRRARSCFEEIGDLSRLAMVHHNIGMTHLHKGAFKDALREFEQSFVLATDIGDVNLLGLSHLGKAQVSCSLKDYRYARELVNKSLGQFKGSNDQLSLADAYKVKGMIHRDTGDFRPAVILFRTSLKINEQYRNPLNEGETYFEMGVLERMRGRRNEAKEYFKRAAACFTSVGAGHLLRRSKGQLDELSKSDS